MAVWVPVVDISEHQGTINFTTMRSKGVPLLIMRASHGQTKDARVTTYYQNALAAGYASHQIGFYSFINPKRGSGMATANATASIIKSVTGGKTDVLYMLDVESYKNESPNQGTSPVAGAAFAGYLREHMAEFRSRMPGCRIIAYTNRAYWNSAEGPNNAALAAELEWLVPRYPLYSTAAYDTKGYPPVPSQWDEYAFKLATGPFPPTGATWAGWQFSAGFNKQGPVYGCQSSDLDLNILDDAAADRWFPSPFTPPPVPPIIPKEPDVLIPHDGARLTDQVFLADTETQVAVAPATPANATGVAVNITFVGSLKPGFAAVWSGEGDAPVISQVNWSASATPTNSFTISKIVNGKFSVQATEEVRLIFDQVGYTMPPVVGPQGKEGPPGAPGAPGQPGEKGDKGDPGQGADPQFIIDTVTTALNT